MRKYISLLRGINVSGNNQLPMEALKKVYQALGCVQVRTYIQSGNVVFQTANSVKTLEHNLSHIIKEVFGYVVPVLVKEASFFNRVITHNPFKNFDTHTLYATLLGDVAHQAQLENIAGDAGGGDKFVIQEGVVYVHCPKGYGKTRFNNSFFETRTGAWTTTRNWKTICKLVELASFQHESQQKI